MSPDELLPDAVVPLTSYGWSSTNWEDEVCLNGDLLLENRWQMTPGLYTNPDIGEGPDTWSI